MNSIQLLRDFQKLGCGNETKRAIASLLYIDLIDVVGLQQVEKFYDSQLDEIYFCGYEPSKSSEKALYLPTSSYGNLDFLQVEKIQNRLCRDGIKSIVLCICDASSTIVYYRLTNGFQELKKQAEKLS